MPGIGVAVSPVFVSGAPAFDPLTVLAQYGLTGYWEAGTEVTNVSGFASAWGNAASADANHTWQQAVAADRLTINATGTPNGKQSLEFADSTDEFTITTTTLGSFFAAGAKTCWFVCKPHTVIAVGFRGIIGDNAGRWAISYDSNAQTMRVLNNDGTPNSVTIAANRGTWYVFEMRHESGTMYWKSNTAAEVSFATGNTLAFGGQIELRFSSDLSGCGIGAIVMCNQVVPTAVRGDMFNYLRNYYGI